MNTNKEIEEIIKKNLPAHVGDVLKERLEQAERDAKLLTEFKNLHSNKAEEIAKLNSIITEYKKHDERNSELDQRERELNKQAFNLELTILRSQIDTEREKSEFVKSITMGLVRNTEYKRNVFDSENQTGYYDGEHRWVQPTPIAKSLIETKTKE